MDWNIIVGKWKQLKGSAQEQWGKLTDTIWIRPRATVSS